MSENEVRLIEEVMNEEF